MTTNDLFKVFLQFSEDAQRHQQFKQLFTKLRKFIETSDESALRQMFALLLSSPSDILAGCAFEIFDKFDFPTRAHVAQQFAPFLPVLLGTAKTYQRAQICHRMYFVEASLEGSQLFLACADALDTPGLVNRLRAMELARQKLKETAFYRQHTSDGFRTAGYLYNFSERFIRLNQPSANHESNSQAWFTNRNQLIAEPIVTDAMQRFLSAEDQATVVAKNDLWILDAACRNNRAYEDGRITTPATVIKQATESLKKELRNLPESRKLQQRIRKLFQSTTRAATPDAFLASLTASRAFTYDADFRTVVDKTYPSVQSLLDVLLLESFATSGSYRYSASKPTEAVLQLIQAFSADLQSAEEAVLHLCLVRAVDEALHERPEFTQAFSNFLRHGEPSVVLAICKIFGLELQQLPQLMTDTESLRQSEAQLERACEFLRSRKLLSCASFTHMTTTQRIRLLSETRKLRPKVEKLQKLASFRMRPPPTATVARPRYRTDAALGAQFAKSLVDSTVVQCLKRDDVAEFRRCFSHLPPETSLQLPASVFFGRDEITEYLLLDACLIFKAPQCFREVAASPNGSALLLERYLNPLKKQAEREQKREIQDMQIQLSTRTAVEDESSVTHDRKFTVAELPVFLFAPQLLPEFSDDFVDVGHAQDDADDAEDEDAPEEERLACVGALQTEYARCIQLLQQLEEHDAYQPIFDAVMSGLRPDHLVPEAVEEIMACRSPGSAQSLFLGLTQASGTLLPEERCRQFLKELQRASSTAKRNVQRIVSRTAVSAALSEPLGIAESYEMLLKHVTEPASDFHELRLFSQLRLPVQYWAMLKQPSKVREVLFSGLVKSRQDFDALFECLADTAEIVFRQAGQTERSRKL